ncbi:unnamed protein product [Amoebophrya sp. A120]|nr:unnamed protein product [Amoebophrya sp. A120]|eukprot:GSA120T00002436001.1
MDIMFQKHHVFIVLTILLFSAFEYTDGSRVLLPPLKPRSAQDTNESVASRLEVFHALSGTLIHATSALQVPVRRDGSICLVDKQTVVNILSSRYEPHNSVSFLGDVVQMLPYGSPGKNAKDVGANEVQKIAPFGIYCPDKASDKVGADKEGQDRSPTGSSSTVSDADQDDNANSSTVSSRESRNIKSAEAGSPLFRVNVLFRRDSIFVAHLQDFKILLEGMERHYARGSLGVAGNGVCARKDEKEEVVSIPPPLGPAHYEEHNPFVCSTNAVLRSAVLNYHRQGLGGIFASLVRGLFRVAHIWNEVEPFRPFRGASKWMVETTCYGPDLWIASLDGFEEKVLPNAEVQTAFALARGAPFKAWVMESVETSPEFFCSTKQMSFRWRAADSTTSDTAQPVNCEKATYLELAYTYTRDGKYRLTNLILRLRIRGETVIKAHLYVT